MSPLHSLLLRLRIIVIITRFRPWSPIATGNYLNRAEENSKFAQTTSTIDVFDPPQAFRDPLRGELLHVQIFMNDGPKTVT